MFNRFSKCFSCLVVIIHHIQSFKFNNISSKCSILKTLSYFVPITWIDVVLNSSLLILFGDGVKTDFIGFKQTERFDVVAVEEVKQKLFNC